MRGRSSKRTVLDVLDGQLARLSPFCSALVLTAAAVAAIVPSHFLIRYLQALPVQPAAAINLVGNAIKFTPAGGNVRVGGRRLDDGGYEIYFRDSGVGMREEDIAVACTPFGQIANMTGTRHTGTGLGLPLAKAIMELHCGTMSIASAPGKGTTVMVTFPASRVLDESDTAQRVA